MENTILSYVYRYVNNKESIKEDETYEFIHNNVDILKDNFTMDEFMMWALYERNYYYYSKHRVCNYHVSNSIS